MTATPSDAQSEQVIVAFAVEIALDPPAESDDMDPVAYGGQILRDAVAGWGIPVVRIVHLANPDDVFTE